MPEKVIILKEFPKKDKKEIKIISESPPGTVLAMVRGRLRRMPAKAYAMARAAEERRLSLSDMGRSKCWTCGKEFEDNDFCDSCKTFVCPYCLTHYCNLPEAAKKALDAEMFSLGLWSPYTNPCRRKKRRGEGE